MTERSSRLFRIAAVAAFVLAGVALGRMALRPAAPGLQEEIEVTAEPSKVDHVAEIRLVATNGVLRPNVVYGPAGEPLRILVRGRTGGPDRLAVPGLGIAADIAPGRDTVIAVPTTPRGAFPITDGAGKTIGALRFQ